MPLKLVEVVNTPEFAAIRSTEDAFIAGATAALGIIVDSLIDDVEQMDEIHEEEGFMTLYSGGLIALRDEIREAIS